MNRYNNFYSLPTIEQVNFLNFMETLKTFDPALFNIKIALEEMSINPNFIPRVIRAIGNLAFGTGYGKVQIFIENKKVSQVKGEESTLVNEDVLV